MSDILPVFRSHYSISSSLLTLEEVGKTDLGNPVSICDLAKQYGVKHVVVQDSRIDGFLEAYKNIQKAGIAQLVYGVKLTVCSDISDKTEASLGTESRVAVFVRNTQGYSDLIRIYNRAWTDGFYYRGRADWKLLREYWTPNLTLVLPYFNSFLARNALTMDSIVPSLPVPIDQITVFREVDSGLPFAPLIDESIDEFARQSGATIQETKSVYYADRAAFKAYQVLRCISERSTFDKPNIDNLCSDRFAFSEYLRLRGVV